MKSLKKIVSIILVFTVIAITFSSCSTFGNKPQYKENANGYTLFRYKGSSKETSLTIPDTYEGKAVTELADFSIANSEYLKEINIGPNIKTINAWALCNCQLLERINVSEDNPNYKSVDGVLYNKDMTELISYPNGKTQLKKDKNDKIIGGGEIVIPKTVKVIKENAFYLCSNLYSVTFNEGLEKIESNAFIKCTNLNSLDLPATLTQIGNDSFSYCDSLKKVEIPSSVKVIGNYAFFSTASSIEKVVVYQNSEKDIKLGKKWLPNKKNNIQETVPIEYAGIK